MCVCVFVIFKNNESYIHPISPLKTRSRTQTLKIPTPKPKLFFNSWPFCSSSFSVLFLPLVADESAFDRQTVLSLIGKRLSVSFCFLFRAYVSFTSSFTSSTSSSSENSSWLHFAKTLLAFSSFFPLNLFTNFFLAHCLIKFTFIFLRFEIRFHF